MRLLLVEDDNMIGEAVRAGLRQEGFTVDWVREAEAGDAALRTEPYALLLLDLGLPRKSGLDWLRELRRRGDPTPVLVITARDAVADRIAGLDGGADDYMVKPFAFEEVLARIRALLRRPNFTEPVRLAVADLEMDLSTRQVTRRGRPIDLTFREFELLHVLMRHEGRIVSRGMLAQC